MFDAGAWRKDCREAVTDEDRENLQKCGFDLDSATVYKVPLPTWGTPFDVGETRAVLDDNGNIIFVVRP